MSAARRPDDDPWLPSPKRTGALQRRLLRWYAANGRDLPWRRTCDPYAVLVSEVMLQQTQVARVVPRFERWLRRYPTLEALAGAPLADVLREWAGLGYNTRARRLHDCAVTLSEADSPASLPRTLEGLLALPGVGPYSARAVLVFAHNDDLAAVDANVRRVLVRELRLPHDLPAARLQAVADAALPRGRARDWHNALMDYGALVLTARTAGLPAARRQGPYEGSRRWYRARLLRLLLSQGTSGTAALARALELDVAAVEDLIEALAADGLVRRDGTSVSIA